MELLLERTMAKKKNEGAMSILIEVEALEAAKIAVAFKGLTVKDYASRVLLEHANRDIEEGYRSRSAPPVPAKPKRPKGNDS